MSPVAAEIVSHSLCPHVFDHPSMQDVIYAERAGSSICLGKLEGSTVPFEPTLDWDRDCDWVERFNMPILGNHIRGRVQEHT